METVLDQINELQYDENKKSKVVWDRGEPASIPGLYVAVRSSGKKFFYFSYRTKFYTIFKSRKINIGDAGLIRLSEARKIAKDFYVQVALGKDPKLDWLTVKEEISINMAFEKLNIEHWGKDRFIKSGRSKEINNLYNAHIKSPFGNKKLSELKREEVFNWHDKKHELPFVANRALEVLSTVYNQAITRGWTEVNPCKNISAFPERKRKRVATKEELNCIVNVLYGVATGPSNRRDYKAAIFILALLLTGARPTSLQRAKWDDFDFETSTLRVEGKKFGDTLEHDEISFPTILVSILNLRAKNLNGKIFSSKAYRRVWKELLSTFGLSDLWLRDLRRSFASVGLDRGISIDKLAESLNHKSTQTTKIYAKLLDDTRFKTANAIAEEMLQIGGIIQPVLEVPCREVHATPSTENGAVP